MKKNRSLFESFDIYSLPITLRYNSRVSYATSQGGLCSFISIIIIIIMIIIKAGETNSKIDLTDVGVLNTIH
jgi:hypothetical protein